ncbi:MAG: CPBP family intramembrane metalloprotease [Chloroflexi bacterium]|nr:CPBP family intramembrane metalloprotease [Chloroflexota bacterium]
MTSPERRPSLIARIAAPEPAPPWDLLAAGIAVVFAFFAPVFGVLVAQAWFEGQPYATLAGWALGSLATAAFVWQTRRRPEDRAALRLGPSTTPLPFVMFIAVGFALAFDLIGLALTGDFLPTPELLGFDVAAASVVAWIVAFVFMVIAQPVAETLVLRGLAFPALRTAFGPWPGLILCALLHALLHLLTYPPNYIGVGPISPIWYGFALPLLDALVICVVRAVTGSTRAALVAHAAFGLFALLKLFVIVT